MSNEVLTSILSLHSKVDGVAGEVKDLRAEITGLDCKVNNNKIKNLEKVVYGAIAIVLIGFMASLLNFNGNTSAVAETKKNTVIKEKK